LQEAIYKIDIVAGTLIDRLNTSTIAGSREDHPEKALEQYCLEQATKRYQNEQAYLTGENKYSKRRIIITSRNSR